METVLPAVCQIGEFIGRSFGFVYPATTCFSSSTNIMARYQDTFTKFHVINSYGEYHCTNQLNEPKLFTPYFILSYWLYVICICSQIRAHDQVMQAASRLIPAAMREQFHLLIGTRLLMNTPESKLETMIFDILGHMNKGIRLIQANDQKYEVKLWTCVCHISRCNFAHPFISSTYLVWRLPVLIWWQAKAA